MPAPKGNQNAKGNKGGGRSKLADEEFLNKVWEGKVKTTVKKFRIVKKVYKGKVIKYKIPVFSSGKQAFVFYIQNGNEKMLSKLMDKLFSDKREVAGPGGGPININWEK